MVSGKQEGRHSDFQSTPGNVGAVNCSGCKDVLDNASIQEKKKIRHTISCLKFDGTFYLRKKIHSDRLSSHHLHTGKTFFFLRLGTHFIKQPFGHYSK